VRGNDNRSGLQFDQDNILDQQIGKILADDNTFVVDCNRFLLKNIQPSLTKLNCDRIFINLLEKSKSEGVIYLVKSLNYFTCYFRVFKSAIYR
jgi:hypothetical protein